MNKRIKELALQAGYNPLPGFDFANSIEEIYLKKFAELIVKDCAYIADMNYSLGGPTGIIMKKYFGIEE